MKKSVLMLALIAIFLSANVVAQTAPKSTKAKTEVKASNKACCDKTTAEASKVKGEACKDNANAKPCCKDKANAEAKPCSKDQAKTDAKPCCKDTKVETAKK